MMKLEIGTILCSTWGYEAKIANFYKVVKLTSKMVTLQELPKIETGNWIEVNPCLILLLSHIEI